MVSQTFPRHYFYALSTGVTSAAARVCLGGICIVAGDQPNATSEDQIRPEPVDHGTHRMQSPEDRSHGFLCLGPRVSGLPFH